MYRSNCQTEPVLAEPAPLITADHAHVRGLGWDGTRIADAIFRLRNDNIQGLPPQGTGDPHTFGRLYVEHPDTWRLLLTHDDQVVGCWHFLPLTPDLFQLAMQGQLNACDLQPQMIQPLHDAGWYDVYTLTYLVSPQWRYSAASLKFARSMFDVICQLAHRSVFIRELGANFVTKEGLAIGRALGLRHVCDHYIRGSIFCGSLPQLLQEMNYTDRRGTMVRQLRELYAAAGPMTREER